MNPIAPKISWEKLNTIEKFLWLTPFLGKHRENYKNASSILKTRPEFPVQEWDSFTTTEATESFLLTLRDVL